MRTARRRQTGWFGPRGIASINIAAIVVKDTGGSNTGRRYLTCYLEEHRPTRSQVAQNDTQASPTDPPISALEPAFPSGVIRLTRPARGSGMAPSLRSRAD